MFEYRGNESSFEDGLDNQLDSTPGEESPVLQLETSAGVRRLSEFVEEENAGEIMHEFEFTSEDGRKVREVFDLLILCILVTN